MRHHWVREDKMTTVYDATRCDLGEGPLWHPVREELFWFDILNAKLHRKGQSWTFDHMVSAAGWIDESSLLVASEVALSRFDLETGASEVLCPLEQDNPITRSNDGRADPHGGLWIGTMGKSAEAGAGSIWRYYRGELRQLFPNITIPNAICFSPDGLTAYFTDTADGRIMRQRLSEADGWPVGEPEVFVDARGESWGADGAIVDAEGRFWNARWGTGEVAAYRPDGTLDEIIRFPALHTTCPAIGNGDLYCTSARQGLGADDLSSDAPHGQTFVAPLGLRGQAEHQIIL